MHGTGNLIIFCTNSLTPFLLEEGGLTNTVELRSGLASALSTIYDQRPVTSKEATLVYAPTVSLQGRRPLRKHTSAGPSKHWIADRVVHLLNGFLSLAALN